MQTHKPYIFISYSSKDEKLAKSLSKNLESIGARLFLDKKDIKLGDNFKVEISKGLEKCTDLILIASQFSLESQWVSFELGQAIAFRSRILILLTNPELKLPSFLSEIQVAKSELEIVDYFKRQQTKYNTPKGVILKRPSSHSVKDELILKPSVRISQFLEHFPSSWFNNHVAIDGAVELHSFPNHSNPYGGINKDFLNTFVTNTEWSDLAIKEMSSHKLDILGNELRSWIGTRRAKPNRIRFLTEPPLQMVLDHNEFQMSIGNSDYFTMRTIANLSRKSHNSSANEPISKVFDDWWGPSETPFSASTVPYHISAQGVLFVTDPETQIQYLILTLPNRQRNPLVPGWNATFAEQMWAPTPETPKQAWWQSYTSDLSIDSPTSRTGDKDIWDTIKRGLYEELGISESDLSSKPKLVASCIEQDIHFVAFIFVIEASLTIKELHKRRLSAPDKEIGPIAAYPIDGIISKNKQLDPIDQFTSLLSMEKFDGGSFIIPSKEESILEPWHLSSRLRIYVSARHLVGARLLDYITIVT